MSSTNPIRFVEIPVTDMDRAVLFYEAVFSVDLERQTIDGYEMALFPFDPAAHGATAALAKGDVYRPAQVGPIVYFAVDSIDSTLSRARARGAKTLYEKKSAGDWGWVAEIEDSEGNRVALHEAGAGA
ncbi:glyoxalase [beta proteobacterium AAP99]|nr:glyoxalase [beta proteobacterium AAP99]